MRVTPPCGRQTIDRQLPIRFSTVDMFTVARAKTHSQTVYYTLDMTADAAAPKAKKAAKPKVPVVPKVPVRTSLSTSWPTTTTRG